MSSDAGHLESHSADRDRVVLVSAADSRYAMPLAVMLSSSAAALSSGVGLDVYILDGGLKSRHRRLIRRSVRRPDTTVNYVQPPTDVLAGVPVFGHVSLSTYFRLLMPEVLPAAVHKAIYVDADCVVLGDLRQLWNEGLHGLPLAAAPALVPELLTEEELASFWRETDRLGAGVLVLDLDAWRREHLSRKIIEYIVENRDSVEFWDQDGINAVLKGRWHKLAIRWNYRVDCADSRPAGRVDVDRIRRRAGILHYASAAKPWHYFSEHPSGVIFFERLDQTAWKGWRPKPPLRVLRNRHYWGGKAARMPVVGWVYRALRAVMKGPR